MGTDGRGPALSTAGGLGRPLPPHNSSESSERAANTRPGTQFKLTKLFDKMRPHCPVHVPLYGLSGLGTPHWQFNRRGRCFRHTVGGTMNVSKGIFDSQVRRHSLLTPLPAIIGYSRG